MLASEVIRQRRIEYQRNRRAWLKAAGICIECARVPVATTTRCRPCANLNTERTALRKAKPDVMSYDDIADGMTWEAFVSVWVLIGQAAADRMPLTPQRWRYLSRLAQQYEGCTQSQARWLYRSGLKKLQRECKRLGLDIADVIGKPASMLARAEMWGEAS